MFGDPTCRALRRPRSCLGPVALLALALVPGRAAADPDPSRPARLDMTTEELAAAGLGQYRGTAIPVPDDAPRERVPGQTRARATQGRIFVNFEGGVLSGGWDDSRFNITQIDELVGDFAVYGGGDKREAVMQALRTDWAPFDVVITDTRPASGNYTMNMTGPTNPFGAGVLGIAPLDCDDSQTHNNITFAFHGSHDELSAAVTATTISQEVAHSYGLEHVDEPGDIMNPYNAGGDAAFLDSCITIVSEQGVTCGAQHVDQCGSPGEQNSYAELMTLFGRADPDTAAPTVAITVPSDGESFATGSDVTLLVEADDNRGIEHVALFSNDDAQGSDLSPPYGWELVDIPAGTYEIYVVARDLAGNEGLSAAITIMVGDASSDEDGIVLSVGGEGHDLDTGLGDADSCTCTTGRGIGSSFGVLMTVCLGSCRRRRKRADPRLESQ
jgi:Bacterial Ig domain